MLLLIFIITYARQAVQNSIRKTEKRVELAFFRCSVFATPHPVEFGMQKGRGNAADNLQELDHAKKITNISRTA